MHDIYSEKKYWNDIKMTDLTIVTKKVVSLHVWDLVNVLV